MADDNEFTLWHAEQSNQLQGLPFRREYLDQMGYLSHYERLPLICEWYARGQLSSGDLARLLSEWWTHSGYAHNIGWETDDWVDMFEYADRFISDSPEQKPPTEPLKVWRGGIPGATHGLSWTTSFEVAEFFAKRGVWKTGQAMVWEATVSPTFVFGIFVGRNEHEVVLNPSGLERMKVIAQYSGETARPSDLSWIELAP